MSGILNAKSRVIDAIITLEGRRQLANGDLRVEYVSFTDTGTYYSPDVVSGSSDATSRIYLEACNLPQDQITFEADDSGRLRPFNNTNGTQVRDGQIVSYSFPALTGSVLTGSLDGVEILTGDEFASQASNLLSTAVDNFGRLQIVGTKDRIFEDDGFGIGPSSIEFIINDDRPIRDRRSHVVNINQVESLFNDVRLNRVANFKYLPPINKTTDKNVDRSNPRSFSNVHLGNYVPWGRTHAFPLSYAQVRHELSYYEGLGYSKTINIDPTSRSNRLAVQFFERNHSQLKKLDVIDFGQHRTNDINNPLAHVFFVGKIVTDGNDTMTFVHLFTLIFD